MLTVTPYHSDSQQGCTSLHSINKEGEFIFLHNLNSISFQLFCYHSRFDWVWQIFEVICLNLIAKNDEYFLRYFLIIFISSFRNSLFKSLAFIFFLDYNIKSFALFQFCGVFPLIFVMCM